LTSSSVANLMGAVVTRTRKSVDYAYTDQKDQIDVGIKLDFRRAKQACTILWVILATEPFPPERPYRRNCAQVFSLIRIATLRPHAITEVISDRSLGAT
jgi:hypothetical protein